MQILLNINYEKKKYSDMHDVVMDRDKKTNENWDK